VNLILRSILVLAIGSALLLPAMALAAPPPKPVKPKPPAPDPEHPKPPKGPRTVKLGKSALAPSEFKFETLPEKTPAWAPGYAVRYPLRIVNDPASQPAKSVMARVPTGGWLNKDGATSSRKTQPAR